MKGSLFLDSIAPAERALINTSPPATTMPKRRCFCDVCLVGCGTAKWMTKLLDMNSSHICTIDGIVATAAFNARSMICYALQHRLAIPE